MADITRLCVLGATGSVGTAALSVARTHRVPVACLTANTNAAAMRDLCLEFRPDVAVMRDETAAQQLGDMLKGESIKIQSGNEALQQAASHNCNTVIAAIAGAGGLLPTLEAARLGRRILLANKESLVAAGELLMQTAADNNAQILPIDSEHAALYELLESGRDYAHLWLTASGGAVRDVPLSKLPEVSPKTALAHPTWRMGKKITVDSATMMNKVLEIIEATVLFSAAPGKVGAVLHPQSIVHGLVEFADGTLTAHLSSPDMRRPIARMLFLDDKQQSPFSGSQLDWTALSSLSFSEPDAARYPCLALARRALDIGGAAPAVLSAANEEAVARFLSGQIKFTDIARINEMVLDECAGRPSATLNDLQAADEYARNWACDAQV